MDLSFGGISVFYLRKSLTFGIIFTFKMVECKTRAPMKILIEDLKTFEKVGENWIYKCSERNFSIKIIKIFIQGKIIKTAGFSNEILIIDDGTGKAKVTRGSKAPGDLSWVGAGMFCSILGVLVENGKLPVIIADKIAKITHEVLIEMWPWEVKELKGIIANEIFQKLPDNNNFEIYECF